MAAPLLFALSLLCPQRVAAGQAPLPTRAPALEASDMTGAKHSLAEYRGRIVVLNFWATWCGPCRAETPALVAVQKEWAERGVEVIGYTSNGRSDLPQVKQFVSALHVTYPIWLGANGGDLEAFGFAWTIPATVIIGRGGEIAARISGPVTVEWLRTELAKLLPSDSRPR